MREKKEDATKKGNIRRRQKEAAPKHRKVSVHTHKRKEIHYGHEENRMQKCREEEEEKEEKVYEQKTKRTNTAA
jgi:hypothetical protein